MTYEIFSDSSSFTMELGEKIAHILPDGSTICFDGDLGAGFLLLTSNENSFSLIALAELIISLLQDKVSFIL